MNNNAKTLGTTIINGYIYDGRGGVSNKYDIKNINLNNIFKNAILFTNTEGNDTEDNQIQPSKSNEELEDKD